MDCIFCKIISGEIPAYKVYEDDSVLAFLDITPVNPGHTLVVPKKHFETLLDLPEEEAAKMISVVKKITPIILAAVESDGFNLNLNNGTVSGQLVNHVHWHIIPRFSADGRELWRGQSYPAGEAEKILKNIQSNKAD